MSFLVNFDWFRLPLEKWIEYLFGMDSWIVNKGGPVFDVIRFPVRALLDYIEYFFLWLPWPVVIIVAALIGWRMAGLSVSIFVCTGLLLIGFLGLWQLAMSTLSIMTTAVLLSLVIGIPTGILMAKSKMAGHIIRPILDIMQTIPTFVYLIPVAMFFGIGKLPGVIATVVYATPPAARLTDLGIKQVHKETLEAAESFGANSFQMLFEIQIPLAWPSIMAGLNQTIMMALGMVVISALIGAQGLGMEVWIGLSQLRVGRAAVAGISIVIMAMILDRITQNLGKSSK
jgi:ABC-type proline/glycine betaine transport system permease subunit